MSLWDVNLRPWTGSNFESIAPETILLEYNGLITFTFRDTSNNLMLAHLSGEDAERARYIVAPTSDLIIDRLRGGTITLRGALDQPIIWIVDITNEAVIASWTGILSNLPSIAVPREDAMLHPSLKPLLKLKAPGAGFRLGAVVADAIRNLMDRAEAAIDGLISHIAPDDKGSYEIEVRQLQFNSIEIAFQPKRKDDAPSMFAEADVLPRIETMLNAGFRWLADNNVELPTNDEKAILTAMRELSPKQQGPISKIEVSGKAVGSAEPAISLTSETRRTISNRIRPPRIYNISMVGQVRELDAGDVGASDCSFELRNIRGDGIARDRVVFNFARDDFWDDVYSHLNQDTWVRASGELESGSTTRYRLNEFEEVGGDAAD